MGVSLRASCSVCGNVSGYDKESLKGSTITINGLKTVLCCNCEDELLVKLARRRMIGIKLGYGGVVIKLDVGAYVDRDILKLADGYKIKEV